MGKIIINGQKLTFQQIREGQWPEQSPYFQASLDFCQEWLSGKTTFQLQSSGSTGTPKTIEVSRTQMMSSAKATARFFHIPSQANLLCCLNTAMIAGKMMLVRAMEWNSRLYLVEPASNPLLGLPLDQRIDFATMVPLQLETCLADNSSAMALGNIRVLLIGGVPLTEGLREKARQLPTELYQTYGMTETVSHIALADLKAEGPLTYHALPGVELRLNSKGGLDIKAPMSNDSWISTNDVVDILPDGGFVWKGRSDFTINTGGVKVQPEEVEALAAEIIAGYYPGRRYFVSPLPDERLGQQVVLVIEDEPENHNTREVLEALKKILPPYHAPKSLLFIPKFEETASHKINRLRTMERWKAFKQTGQQE